MIDQELFADLGIPADYGQNPHRLAYADAADLEDVEPNIVGKPQRLAPATARSWRQMKHTAALAGVDLLLVSGFRSIRQQTDLFRQKIAAGRDIHTILRVNAAPGFSEHHTGRAIDIATPGTRPLTAEFESSKAFAWLTVNAATFGFTMPYGRDNVLGFEFKPWHWSQLKLRSKRSASIQV
ncbi:MAG: M15 family metallopeptidase [Gammaproteobacteria bacterium]